MKERGGEVARAQGWHAVLPSLSLAAQANGLLLPGPFQTSLALSLPQLLIPSPILLFLWPQSTLTAPVTELFLLKGCPLPETRGKDTLGLGAPNRLEGTGRELVPQGFRTPWRRKDAGDRRSQHTLS